MARTTSTLASASGRDVYIWDAAVSQSRSMWKQALDRGEIQTLCWMDEEGVLIAAAGTRDYHIRLFDVRDGRTIQEFQGHIGDVNSLAANKSSTMLASGSKDDTVRIWDLRFTSKNPTQAICCGNRGVRVCRFIDSDVIGVGGYDSFWRQYNIATGDQMGYELQHDGWVFDAAIDNKNDLLATGASNPDYKLRLWDLKSGTLLSELGSNLEHGASVSFSPDLPFLVSGTEGHRLAIHDISRSGY